MSDEPEEIAIRIVGKSNWEGRYKEELPIANCYFASKIFLDYTTLFVREISIVEYFFNMIAHKVSLYI